MYGRSATSPKSNTWMMWRCSRGGGRTSFVQESGFHLFVSRVLALQYLDRNGFTRHPISCAVDIRHSAAEAFQQLVFAENYKILMTNTW
jgi:hypothetical protein